MRKLRIAVAGAGVIGRAHMAVLRESSRCTLSAVADPSDAARQLAQSWGVPWFATLEELMVQDKPDGIILATPNALHVPQALACIAAAVPVLLEKPIAPTVAEAEHLVRQTEAAGAKVLIGHHRAHSPIMAQARSVVASGRLGRLVCVMGSATFYKPDSYFDEALWRREAGGGPILINLIHEVHNLRMLCGEIVKVQALASHAVRGFPVEDTVAINLQFASGALGTFMLSDTAACARSWEQTSQENKRYASYDDEDCYVIAGTDGSLAVPTMRLKTYAHVKDRSWWQPFEIERIALQREDPLKLQIEHFADVIHGTAVPCVSARDGLQNLRVTEAVAEAAKTGHGVAVEFDAECTA